MLAVCQKNDSFVNENHRTGLEKNNSSYNQILKSTSIFGGSQVITILIGLIRTKVIAILLGTAGVGIIGIFYSVIDMIRSTCGMGLDTAGVKEIAEASNENDKELLDKKISKFNLWFKVCAVSGLLICLLFCYPISIWALDDSRYVPYIACLSVSVFFAILATGRFTAMQGMRKIPEIAKANIKGSLTGLLIAVPLYYLWGMESLAVAFIFTFAASYVCIEYYYRKQGVKRYPVSLKESLIGSRETLKLGMFILISGFVGTLSMFLIRAYITRNIDVHAAGLFQSAWTISNVYVGLVLRSMGSDFFPRLSAIAVAKEQVKKLVNEQSYIVLIIASPLVVGMLLFSDFALQLLYSSEFALADDVLRWQILGTFLKVLGWPISFILLAKNRGLTFLLSEILFYTTYLLSVYLLYPLYGLSATGVGYLIAYVVYLPAIYIIGYKISGFCWNNKVIKMAGANLIFTTAAFCISRFHVEYSWLWSTLLMIVSVLYAYYKLKDVFSLDDLKNWFRKK